MKQLWLQDNPISDMAPLQTLLEKNPDLEVDTAIPAAPAPLPTLPNLTALHPNYPNPFNPETWIPYELATDTDLEVLADYGLAGLRRHRILRLTQEAYDQDALLSYEDLAVLLTTSPATVKRDIRALKHDGYFVMTRGAKHDMGPGLSHKTQILELYFKAYTFSEIEQKTNHTERAVSRYLRDFTQVATLHHQGFPSAQIRLITHLSDRLIREYLSLYEEYQHTDRMTELLHPEPMDEKKGDL